MHINCVNLDVVKSECISFLVELLMCGTVYRNPRVSFKSLRSFKHTINTVDFTNFLKSFSAGFNGSCCFLLLALSSGSQFLY